ncbi:uncharacterized protein LOC122322375 [Drosophila grimshawi]|uniref:uncharacterized protein LOC122322375 n=1 Tax=Drosophila grimshawi TaxID=7222 RepID=UPI001C934CE8|nr:uncharacterized protein LOC122322375 [Drosophila grimshawi]
MAGTLRPPRPSTERREARRSAPKRKGEFLPPRGQPGGLDDPNRRNPCGSRVKWYLRYRQQGLTPEAALKKATEPREEVSAPAPPPKRRSSNLTPSVATPKRVCPRLSSGKDMAKKVKVAVLPLDFPWAMLNLRDLSVLEEAIIDEANASGGDVAVSFAGIHFTVGFLVIECSDETSAVWLNTAAPHCITLFCPRSVDRSTESLLVLLRNQNRIETDTWKVISRRSEGGGALLVIGIDELSKNIIVEKGHQAFFRYRTIPVNTPAPEQSSRTAQPTDSSEDLADDEKLAVVTLCKEEMLGEGGIPMFSQELEEELQGAAVADVVMTSSGDGGNSRPQSPCQLEPLQQ